MNPSAPSRAADEVDAERRIRATFLQVRTWHDTPLFRTIPGSELAGDDADWPKLGPSQLIKFGLDSNAEHLHALATLIEAGEVLTLGSRSLLRTATVGAAQAVYLLAPDDRVERRRRHRMLVLELYKRHVQYLDGLLQIPTSAGDQLHANTVAMRSTTVKNQQEIERRRSADDETMTWEDTRTIKEAARSAWGHRPDGADLMRDAELEWRAGSGSAHVLPWPLFGATGVSAIGPSENGVATIVATPSFARLLNGYLLAYELANHGWKLLRKRGR